MIMAPYIGVREGILLGGRNKFALKITICPENSLFILIQMGPESLVNRAAESEVPTPTPGNFDYPTPTPDRLRPSAVLVS